MKFGHYSNEELGIKRNLTCAMFDSKGAGITPPKPEAKDLQCALDNAREFVKKSLIEQAEDFFGFKASDYKDCAQKIYTSYKGGKLYDWGGGTDVDDIIRGCIGDYFGGTLRDLKKEGISASAAQKLLQEELKKFEAAVRPYAEKMQKVVLKAKAEDEKKNSKKMSNDLDEISAELEDKEMDNELDELQAGLDEDMENELDEADMSEGDEEIQAGLEDEAECGLDDETEMPEDELDALCSIDDETDCENDDDEVEMSEDDDEAEMDNSIDEDLNVSCANIKQIPEWKLSKVCYDGINELVKPTEKKIYARYVSGELDETGVDEAVRKNSLGGDVKDPNTKTRLKKKVIAYVINKLGIDKSDKESVELLDKAFETGWKVRLHTCRKNALDIIRIGNTAKKKQGKSMSNEIDEPKDVKCSRRRGRGRNMSNEIDNAKDAACSRKHGRKMCNEIDNKDVKCATPKKKPSNQKTKKATKKTNNGASKRLPQKDGMTITGDYKGKGFGHLPYI